MIVASMLKINPVARPDCASIIQKIEKLGKAPQSARGEVNPVISDHNLLGTIAIPKDLRNLENVLPEAKYDNGRLLQRVELAKANGEKSNNSSNRL